MKVAMLYSSKIGQLINLIITSMAVPLVRFVKPIPVCMKTSSLEARNTLQHF